ncbi:SMC family ATPase [Candidatus Dependentiae bacterium]|nr:SMC family ATPase [Candidatus Dependentiae bacterium]
MIPLKLHIKNFLSYGVNQTIDFRPYNLICLSGKNGHGKSALLDAITWVLWGQARKVSGIAKADEGLMHLGQTTMMVTLDFACDAHSYRVKREYTTAAQKSQTLLEFGIFESDHITIRPLTDKTIRATQTKIEDVLGLDYDSFINSAFLKQGQSNEFSKKTPKERKEILATILGLDRFESLRRIALDTAKEASQRHEQGVTALERLQQDLIHLPQTKSMVTELETTLLDLSKQESLLQDELKTIACALQALLVQKQHAEKIDFQKSHLEKTRVEQTNALLETARLWRTRAGEHRKQTQYTVLEQERTALQKELQELHLKASKKVALREQYLALKERLRLALQQLQEDYKRSHDALKLTEQTLELSLKATAEKEQELSKKIGAYDQELRNIAATIQNFSVLLSKPYVQELEELERCLARRTAYYHRFTTKAHALTEHLEALEHKNELIHATNEAICPLCEQRADRESLSSKFAQQKKSSQRQLERLIRWSNNLKKFIAHDTSLCIQAKARVAEQLAATLKITELEKQKIQHTAELERLHTEKLAQKKLAQELYTQKQQGAQDLITLKQAYSKTQEEDPYKEMNNQLIAIEQEGTRLVVDTSREKIVHETIALLTLLLEKQSLFLQEVAHQDERKRSIRRIVATLLELKKQIASLPDTTLALSSYKQQEIGLLRQEDEKKRELELHATRKEHLIHQKGALEARLSHLIRLTEEYKIQEQKAAQEAARASEYTTIAAALSKDGIQALLIENALPEIEHEANNLLGRLTDNQAHLSIESVRDLKSGKLKETLDIRISDTAGVRPYELFSGGEAFRIDFALRIAISKLLTRRAGSALQTLIIDEGFGSQDEDGLRNIMSSLHAIADDFSKIIIVSHLSSMKDEFPVHFTVSKTAEGSVLEVIQHC